LGPFASCEVKRIGVRVAAKSSSYAKWIGIIPATQSGESCSNVLALAAVLGASQLAK
jgi:hypothetical protein